MHITSQHIQVRYFDFRFLIFLALVTTVGSVSSCGPELSPEIQEAAETLPEQIQFNRHIQPILSDKCYACHGPDAAARQADLDLSKEKTALAVINRGSKNRSELFKRILSSDIEQLMPPPSSNHELSAEDIAMLGKWIDEGAEWQDHWAYIAPSRPEPPSPSSSDWSSNSIDDFVLARLQEEELKPSPTADKETLLRRVTLDLTGLPPSLPEIDAFLADQDPQAYENVTDRLLASSDYGERMAVDWLDLARYADTHGYTVDRYRDHYWYRDWVIEAFNRNQPYDEFVTWQLAGDLLPDPSRDQLIATGFNRNHAQNTEGGIVNEEFLAEYVFDRTETFGAAFLGATLNCVRCHDHKFDPITHKEYFQLFDFFNNVDESGQIAYDFSNPAPTLLLSNDEIDQQIAEIEKLIAAKAEEISEFKSSNDIPAEFSMPSKGVYPRDIVAFAGLEESSIERVHNLVRSDFPGKIFDPIDGVLSKTELLIEPGVRGNGIKLSGDEAIYFPDIAKIHEYDPITVGVWVTLPDSLDEGVLFHNNKGSIFYNYRGFHVYLKDNHWEVVVAYAYPGNAIHLRSRQPVLRSEWQHIAMSYDGSSKASGVGLYKNGQALDMEIVRDNLYKDIVLTTEKEPGLKIGARFRGRGLAGALVDEISVFKRALSAAEILRIVEPGPVREDEDDHVLSSSAARGLDRLNDELRTLRKRRTELIAPLEQAMIIREAEEKPAFVLTRGAYDSPADPVSPGTPESILSFPEDLERNRLGLAKWLSLPDNPLFARVTVNRLWQQLFGRGIVKSSDDFGAQGARPSHPELLDWLAVEFRESGWDVKALMKLMVMSSTYKQSSTDKKSGDPENILLSRGPSFRLTAEMLRDQVLAASGLLDKTMGGKSVRPYQPEGLWRVNSGRYEQSTGKDLYRKSIYSLWKRSVPPPAMDIFDAASRAFSVSQRQKTTTPLQALTLINDPQFLEASRVLAGRLLEKNLDDEQLIESAYRKLTGLRPNVKTNTELLNLLSMEKGRLKKSDAIKMLSVGEYPLTARVDARDQAALMIAINTIINLDASITKR